MVRARLVSLLGLGIPLLLLAPAMVTVDTSANDYTFSGAGHIGGTTSLKKINAGVLTLETVNTYAGGTVVSNGTLRVGANNAISSTGAGGVEVYGAGVIDLNGFNNTFNGLNGSGSVDVLSGGSSVLTVGNNDANGNFSGVLKNTSGTLLNAVLWRVRERPGSQPGILTRLDKDTSGLVVIALTPDVLSLKVAYFPASRASLKDKPYYDEVTRLLVGGRQQSQEPADQPVEK